MTFWLSISLPPKVPVAKEAGEGGGGPALGQRTGNAGLYILTFELANFIPDLIFQGPRPIHWASRNGHVAVVDELLSVSN